MTRPETGGARLEVGGLSKRFAGVPALDDVSFWVSAGELVGLIGPNGSGKTTAIDCISGVQRPDSGQVTFDSEPIFRHPTHRLAQRGLVRSFQGTRVFETLTVRRNLHVAALGRLHHRQRFQWLARRDRHWPDLDDHINDLLFDFGIGSTSEMLAGELSYGQRKLVEFAAAVISSPRLLLLDEPVAAVNPTIAQVIRHWILRLHDQGTSILLVEHNIELVVGICERVVVLDHGAKIADGTPSEVVNRYDVQEAYFGR